jgi:exodeoxyribonuclease-3
MKVASYNANSVRARLPLVLRWLKEHSPDVLCLQETKVQDHDFPEDAFTSAGYRVIYRGEKSYNGVAIASRHPLEAVLYGFDGEGSDEGARLIAASVRGVPVVNTYVPQGYDPASEKFQYKLRWLERLLRFFQERFRRDRPLLWAGDFNVAPEPADVFDPVALSGQIGFHPEEHRALARLREWGFIDVFRMHHAEGGHYTFWDYRVRDAVQNKLGWRVDHIWATPALAGRCTGALIDVIPRLWERPSDHTFVVAEFDDVAG